MHSADNFHVLPLCQMQGSSNTRRRLKGSWATVDRGSEVLFYFEMTCHSAVFFHIAVFVMLKGFSVNVVAQCPQSHIGVKSHGHRSSVSLV